MPTPVDVLVKHPDVCKAYEYYARGVFKTKGSLVFWTNDNENDAAGKLIRWGQVVAERYCETNKDAHIMGHFETVGGIAGNMGIIKLTDYVKREFEYQKATKGRDLSDHEKDRIEDTDKALAAAASYSFARSASGTVVVSARGAFSDGFFREIEFNPLMQNPEVTHIRLISRVDPKDRLLPKHEAFHTLRDEWLEYSYNRCRSAKELYESGVGGPFAETYATAYNINLKYLATELLIARRSLDNPYPLSVEDVSKAGGRGRGREDGRIAMGDRFMADFPEIPGIAPSLRDKVDRPEVWEEPSRIRQIIDALDREYTGISPEDIRRVTAQTITSVPRDPGIVIIKKERALATTVARAGVPAAGMIAPTSVTRGAPTGGVVVRRP